VLHESPDPLWEAYDVAMLDLDGVVYIGGDPVPGAPEHLAAARSAGMQLAYVTRCYRAVVRHQELPPEPPPPTRRPVESSGDGTVADAASVPTSPTRKPPEDPGTQLIDFR